MATLGSNKFNKDIRLKGLLNVPITNVGLELQPKIRPNKKYSGLWVGDYFGFGIEHLAGFRSGEESFTLISSHQVLIQLARPLHRNQFRDQLKTQTKKVFIENSAFNN